MIRASRLSIHLPGFAVQEVDLSVAQGEFFALIGPTGSGKTLILEALAGLIRPTKGRVLLEGRDVTSLPPEKRRIGIVYQDNALFPHLSVSKNITYGLRYTPNGEGQRVERLLETLGLAPLRDRDVTTLSGGEAQRVALARALAVEPRVLLLDEPLSALDPAFRHELQVLLKRLHQDTGLTCLMVSHDFGEVMSLAQRVAVLNQGRLEQTGGVEDIFQRPATPFVARFVGMKNVFAAEFRGRTAQVGELSLILDCEPPKLDGHVAMRPDKVRVELNGEAVRPGENRFGGRLRGILDLGPIWEARVDSGGLDFCCLISAEQAGRLIPLVGQRVSLGVRAGDIHII